MSKTNIFFKASDFKYPTRKERKVANENYPILKKFGFEYVYEIISILDNKCLKTVNRESNLHHWDICLLNKLGKLYETYIFLFTSYNRGISESFKDMSEKEWLNSSLFDYYAEIFYYYFYSTRDNIGQILNIYCNLDLKENEVYFNKLATQIANNKIKDIIIDFANSTVITNAFRNNFTHRFPVNYPDYRPNISLENGEETYSAGGGKYTKPSEFMTNINESLILLEKFINKIRNEIKPNR